MKLFSRNKKGAEKATNVLEKMERLEHPIEYPVIELPSIKISYCFTIEECNGDECEISKEETIHDLFSISRIPAKGDYIRFGESDCLFQVTIVSRAQDKNEISIHGNHIGHDGGIVYRKMVEKHGFK